MKLSVSSACCVFTNIFFGQPLDFIKISKNFEQKSSSFFLFGRTRYKKERNRQATRKRSRCVPEKERKTKRDTNKGIKLFRVLTMTRQE